MKFSILVTLTVASTLAILSKSADAATVPCGGKCPSVIAPICAQNAAGLTHTFVNSCELAKSNCQDPRDIYTKISDKSCPGDGMVKRGILDGHVPVPGCPKACPSVIQRICGQNNTGVQVTFINDCRLSVTQCQYPAEGWTQINEGYCPNDSNLHKKRGTFDGPIPVPGCPKTCPSVIQRICGQNNAGVQLTFINECRLSMSQCQYPTKGWTKIKDGYCPNDASLQKRSIRDQPISEQQCSQECPAVITPVCAENKLGQQKTFANSCHMTVANCEYPAEKWTIVERKTCDGDLD